MQRTPGVLSGNAAEAAADKGWFVGHFMTEADTPRATTDVEVKWAVYEGGETRLDWGKNLAGTTLAILVRGRFRLRFPEREVLLAEEGDFALWEPGVPHHWRAETAAIVVTVRWPSLPGDSVLVPTPPSSGAQRTDEGEIASPTPPAPGCPPA